MPNSCADFFPALLERLKTALDEASEEEEKEILAELLGNQDAFTGYYDRGVAIPPKSEAGVVHHARLGSMENNVFILIGNHMKGRRASAVALLMCRHHSVRTEDFFSELPPFPEDEPDEPENMGTPLSAAQIPETTGKGFQCDCHADLPNTVWLKNLTAYRSFIDLKF